MIDDDGNDDDDDGYDDDSDDYKDEDHRDNDIGEDDDREGNNPWWRWGGRWWGSIVLVNSTLLIFTIVNDALSFLHLFICSTPVLTITT